MTAPILDPFAMPSRQGGKSEVLRARMKALPPGANMMVLCASVERGELVATWAREAGLQAKVFPEGDNKPTVVEVIRP